uniref:Zgc:77151 n=1 Tax=Echeneis naucrates TaxID=173247 RepID=A0A665T4H2_ECHNA
MCESSCLCCRPQWLGAPSCQRGSYAFYKSVSSRAQPDGPVQVWRLGEFYFIRCGPQDPVCIAEVTLLWEDQTQRHLLASTRLYFLPEDTPKGRTREHGEDEVLAVSRKMVVRVEDLVRWSCGQPAGWSSSLKLNESKKHQLYCVKVLSYPQYCRFRSLQRRLQDGARGPGLQDPHLLALGAVRALPNTRVMYCRDTFNHPTLESNTNFSWQFRCPSLSLRGRPRKRRGRDGKDSPNSSQSESWIERMKENVMGSVEVGCEGSWLPHPEEQLFLDQLYAFMDRHGSPIHKVPNLGFKKIDLFLMYSVVKRLGGYKKVTAERLWKVVYNELGGCPGSTSAATCTRRHYERSDRPAESPASAELCPTFGNNHVSFRMLFSFPAEISDLTLQIVSTNGGVGVKRGRGRPPGTRNKATLIAQAKLLAQQQLVQPAILPVNMPLTPDLSPLSSPFLPFQPKPKEVKLERGESVAPTPSVLLSALPRHFVGGSLGGFSPIKGVCPLDVFRNRISLQRGPESPALTPQDPSQHHPTISPLQPKSGSPDTPHPSGDQHQNRCSGCTVDEGAQRGGRDARSRPPLPPLRVLPLNLDCSVQVCQLMRTRRLDSSQLQTFTRRLSEALSQDLNPKPPCSPITPPPEQALPLNLSKRFPIKRPSTDGPESSRAAVNGNAGQPSAKRPRSGNMDQADELTPGGRSNSGGSAGGQDTEVKNQEEPADLSSPSRIRAFLLGLPPFQVKLEEDLNGTRFGKFLPSESESDTQRTETERGEGGAVVKKEAKQEQEDGVDLERVQKAEEENSPALCSGPGLAELKSPGPSNTDTHCF